MYQINFLPWFILIFLGICIFILGWISINRSSHLKISLNKINLINLQYLQIQEKYEQICEKYDSVRNESLDILTKLKIAEAEYQQLAHFKDKCLVLQEKLHDAELMREKTNERYAILLQQLKEWQQREDEWHLREQEFTQTMQDLSQARVENGRLSTQLKHERDSFAEKLAILNDARSSLSDQFKALANDILEEKSKRFSEQNKLSLNQLLNPLHERMVGFSQLVQNTYEKESKQRTTLEAELKHLQQLNAQLHNDAKALTDALTGTKNKHQGNWGEMILEKVLENSGLVKGREYVLQASATVIDESGRQRRLQPDVLVNLPENKQIIIDAKTSLTAYARYTQASDQKSAEQALSAHIQSVRQHIKDLSAKNYDEIEGLNTLDFVFMFIPVEPAYLLALQQDSQLFDDCFQKRIMLVGPSTLLATLRTIAHIWRNEQQNQNALNIAKEGGNLYDKFVGFVTTLEGVGKNLNQAQDQFQRAMKQLCSGRGNLVGKAKKLRQLGVQSNKTMPDICREYENVEQPSILLSEID